MYVRVYHGRMVLEVTSLLEVFPEKFYRDVFGKYYHRYRHGVDWVRQRAL